MTPAAFPVTRWLRAGLLALAALVLAGCATGPNPRDPFEPFHRKVMRFNDGLDREVLEPVAVAYRDMVPRPVRTGVGNVLGNFTDVWSFFNSVLQLKMYQAVDLGVRVGVNTFLGLGGLLDVATEMGIERRSEDFGQTLGRWGVPPGPYLVLPGLGPSSMRDATATFTLNRVMDPVLYLRDPAARWSVYALRAVNTRADLLRISSVLDDVALDRYIFTREAYLQHPLAEIGRDRPGDPPPAPADDFDYRDPPDPPAAPPAVPMDNPASGTPPEPPAR